MRAAAAGHEGVVRLLLRWPQHAPRADCQNGMALIQAARKGFKGVVCLLLECPSLADAQGESASSIILRAFDAAVFMDQEEVRGILQPLVSHLF